MKREVRACSCARRMMTTRQIECGTTDVDRNGPKGSSSRSLYEQNAGGSRVLGMNLVSVGVLNSLSLVADHPLIRANANDSQKDVLQCRRRPEEILRGFGNSVINASPRYACACLAVCRSKYAISPSQGSSLACLCLSVAAIPAHTFVFDPKSVGVSMLGQRCS